MTSAQDIASAPSTSSHGFYCVLPPQPLQMTSNPGLARVAHEVRQRPERLRAALGAAAATANH